MNRGGGPVILLTLGCAAVLLSLGSCGSANLTPINDACLCPDSTLQLNCTTVGSGITTWQGTAFSGIGCDSISLQHSQFQNIIDSGAPRFCPNMLIIIRPLSVVDSCYTSQVTVPNVTVELNGSTIVCEHDSDGSVATVGTYPIIFTTEPFPPPNNVSLTAITNGLTFTWEDVAPTCLSLSYAIRASGCGTCPLTADSTSVTCSGVQLRGDTEMCNISVQAITCGNISGSYSEPLITALQAANAPTVTIIPIYSQSTSYLISFTAVIEEVAPVSISGNDVMVQSIQINFRTSDVPACGSNFTHPPCDQGMCSREINVVTSSCTVDANSIVTVSVGASSVLGMGPITTLRIGGSSRSFVRVTSNIESTTRPTITCEFTNQLDSSNKSCNVSYGLCGQQLSRIAQGSSSPEEPNIVRVELDLSGPAAMYCYTVTASNDTFTAVVDSNSPTMATEATTTGTAGSGGLDGGAIAGIVIFVLVIIVVIAVVVVVVILVLIFIPDRQKNKKGKKSPRHVHFQTDPNESVVQLETAEERDSKTDLEAGLADSSLTGSQAQTPSKEKQQIDDNSLPGGVGMAAAGPVTNEDLKKHHEKHSQQVAVVIKRYEGEETLKGIDKQYWVPDNWTMSRMEKRIRTIDLKLSKDHAPLYLTVDNKTVVEGTLTLKEVCSTSQHGGADKYLYIAYSSKDITDPDKS